MLCCDCMILIQLLLNTEIAIYICMHTHTDRYKYIKRLSFNLAKPLHEYEKKSDTA